MNLLITVITQFTPEKKDVDIQKLLDTVNAKLSVTKANLRQIENPGTDNEIILSQFRKSVVDMDDHLKEQQDWLNIYFSRPKSKRKSMFYEKKVTWFGIPVK